MIQLNFEQAYWHCKLLTGEENPTLSFRLYYDVAGKEQRPDLAQNFHGTLRDSWERLNQAQSNYCAVTFTVNGTDGAGAKKENIKTFRAIFVDFDGMTEPKWVVTPSMVTMRDDTHGHAYWFLMPGDITDTDSFERLQKQIQLYYGTDPKCVDATRVMRLSGSVHYKNPSNPAQYTIRTTYDKRYSADELAAAHTLNPVSDSELWEWINSREAHRTGSGFKESPMYNLILKKWCSTVAAPSVEGGNGDDNLIRVCLFARDRGIPLETAQQILWENFNPRCIPPWSEAQKPLFFQSIRNAYTHAKNAAGCLTTESVFKERGELPPPIDGWEANHAVSVPVRATGNVNRINRLSRQDAEVLWGQVTMKTSHYDLAQCFDGMIYDGHKIIRCDKFFYVSNGISWKEVNDDVIKAMIQRFYHEYSPPDSFTSGVFNVFKDLVNRPSIRNGMWLSDPDRDGSNVVVFQDGMVNFNSDNITLEPHDPDFFTFNECDYNFNDDCPTPIWDWFLQTVFNDDQASKDLLHEYMGYCLTNDLSRQKFMTLIGASRSGKGTITRVMTNQVGKNNVCSPSLSNITQASTLHVMSTKKVALIPDAHSVNHNMRDSTLSMLKAFTGGDSVTFDVKYKMAQTIEMPCRLWLSTNGMPEFNDPSGALVNRMLVLVFENSFAGREDYELDAKLYAERVGIRRHLTDGIKRLRRNKRFTEPGRSIIERNEIQEDMFPLSRFVNACCELNEDYLVSVDELFSMYTFWCNTDGVNHPLTKIQFAKTLRHSSLNLKLERPYDDKGARIRSFRGIRVHFSMRDRVVQNTRPAFPVVTDHK